MSDGETHTPEDLTVEKSTVPGEVEKPAESLLSEDY